MLLPRFRPSLNLRHFLFVSIILAVPVAGYTQEDARTRLFQANGIRCQINEGATATWDAGRPTIEKDDFGEGEVIFTSIDPEAGTARMIGNIGAVDVTVLATQIGYTFLEVTDTGNLVIITVFASTPPERPNHFIAVESRHVDWPASWPEAPESENSTGPFPSQYHGTCTILG